VAFVILCLEYALVCLLMTPFDRRVFHAADEHAWPHIGAMKKGAFA